MRTLKKIILEHIRYRRTILKLAKSDLIKTYKNTALGWWWAIVRPSITLAVYYFAFSVGLGIARSVGGYPYFLWLIAGFLPWFFMRDMLVSGAGSIKKYRFLVTKIKYPIATIPTFVCLSGFITQLALSVVVIGIFVCTGNFPTVYWLQIPLYAAMMLLFFILWSLFSGLISSFSSDFYQLVKSVTIMLFWLSGIMYDVNSINTEWIRNLMLINPITIIVNGYRNSFIYKEWFWENLREMVCFLIVFIILLVMTIIVYKRLHRDVVDVL